MLYYAIRSIVWRTRKNVKENGYYDPFTCRAVRFTSLLESSSMENEVRMARGEGGNESQNSRREFRVGQNVFLDPFAIEWLDDREDYGEQRFVTIGMAEGQVLMFVAYTEREEHIRIISARRVTQDEQIEYCRQNSRYA